MNKVMLVMSIAILLVTEAGHAQSGATMKESTGLPDRTLMEEINDAWSSMDPGNAARYYDMSPRNVFYDLTPFKYVGWSAYAAGAREFFATVQSIKYTVGNDAEIHTADKIAWGTATLHLELVDNQGRPIALDLRWTPVWEKRGSRWLIVHEHLSVVSRPHD